ncbi:MAG: NMD3-related protein [Ferroplasma sp.]
MKCILCGKNEAYKFGLCESCLAGKIKLKADPVQLVECPKCGAVKVNKRWYYDNAPKYVLKNVSSHINTDRTDKISSIHDFNIDGNTASMIVVVDDKNLGKIEKALSMDVKLIKESCPVCNRFTGSYYEAVIQLRTFTTEFDEVLQKEKETIVTFMKEMNIRNPNSYISKVEIKKEGIDIYLGKKEDAVKIDRMLQESYFCSILVTKSLAGRKDSRDLYRYTHLIRILDMLPGSILFGKNYCMVKNISPRDMSLLNLDRNISFNVGVKDFFRSPYKVIRKAPDIEKFIVISYNDGESQLMNAVTFKIISFRKEFSGKEVYLYRYNNVYYSF